MQEKKLNPFDDLDTIELDLSGTSQISSTGFSAIDLSGTAGQPVYTLDTMNYDTISYSGVNITAIAGGGSGGSGGAIGTGQYTFTTSGTGGGGGSGYTLSTGTSGYAWNTTTTGIDSSVHITQGGIDMPADADIKIGDRSLKEFMTKMEERMAILVPNPKKIEKFEALKKAYENYKLMERLCQEDNPEKDN
jgi:hypothetical protein